MLSAENASHKENKRQQKAYSERIRHSLTHAATESPWFSDANPSQDSLRRRQTVGSSKRLSIDSANVRRNSAGPTGANKSALKHIKKFEIILSRRSKPDEVQEALVQFRRASINSIKQGLQSPSIKEYVDLGSEAYEPGESVAGNISLVLSNPLPVKNISIRLRGTYIVAFEQRTEGESTTKTEQVIFLQAEATLPVDTQFLEPGVYNYAFKFKLPLNIPGTMFFERFKNVYEGASVVYSIEAVMNIESETNGFYNSPIAKEIVEVIRRYPEHVEKGYQKACSIDKTSNLRICCYNLGSISLRVELSKLIYTEGETLLVNLRLSNNSKLKVRQIDIALVQHSVFKSKTLREDILKARTSLLVHHMSLDNFGYGEINNKIALNLPDEMQTSTMPYILPPTSFMSFHFSNDADTNAARGNPSTKGNPNTKGSPKLKKIETGNDGEDTTFLVLDANYHTLYDIAYYLHIRVRTSIDWFNMKGPEIRFPITIEGRHKAKNSNDAQTEGEKEANDGEKEANADESTKPEDVGVEVADEPEEINSPAS